MLDPAVELLANGGMEGRVHVVIQALVEVAITIEVTLKH